MIIMQSIVFALIRMNFCGQSYIAVIAYLLYIGALLKAFLHLPELVCVLQCAFTLRQKLPFTDGFLQRNTCQLRHCGMAEKVNWSWISWSRITSPSNSPDVVFIDVTRMTWMHVGCIYMGAINVCGNALYTYLPCNPSENLGVGSSLGIVTIPIFSYKSYYDIYLIKSPRCVFYDNFCMLLLRWLK